MCVSATVYDHLEVAAEAGMWGDGSPESVVEELVRYAVREGALGE